MVKGRVIALCAGIACAPAAPGEGDTDVGEVGFTPLAACPGAEGCASNEGPLRAAVAERSIVPACFESWIDTNGDSRLQDDEDFLDCGCDRLCPGDDGYVAPDEGEADGAFQALWVGGFGTNRPAAGMRGADLGLTGVADDLLAQVLLLDQGDVRVAVVTLDIVGLMRDDVEALREAVAAAGHAVDHVIVNSSHSHAAPDGMGPFGPSIDQSGRVPRYIDQIEAAVVDAVGEAVAGLTEVEASAATLDLNALWPKGIGEIINDTRDPWIADPRVRFVRLRAPSGDEVATVVHFANHPETFGSRMNLMSAGFLHALRLGVSGGTTWGSDAARPGLGGTTVVVNGALGGMMTSLGATVTDPVGVARSASSWEKTDAVGWKLADLVLEHADEATPFTPSLRFARRDVRLPVINTGFRLLFNLGVFDHRSTVDWDPTRVPDAENVPKVDAEVTLVEVGPWRLLSLPGEVLPEAVIGGYDGAFLPDGVEIVATDNPNPPDLSAAPAGPYLQDRLGADAWIVGMGSDQLGYLIPAFQFVVDPVLPYLEEADGDHYEETYSLGPETWTLLEQGAHELLDWAGVGEE